MKDGEAKQLKEEEEEKEMEEKSPTEESDGKAKLWGTGEEGKLWEAAKKKGKITYQFRDSGNTCCAYCGIWFIREQLLRYIAHAGWSCAATVSVTPPIAPTATVAQGGR